MTTLTTHCPTSMIRANHSSPLRSSTKLCVPGFRVASTRELNRSRPRSVEAIFVAVVLSSRDRCCNFSRASTLTIAGRLQFFSSFGMARVGLGRTRWILGHHGTSRSSQRWTLVDHVRPNPYNTAGMFDAAVQGPILYKHTHTLYTLRIHPFIHPNSPTFN